MPRLVEGEETLAVHRQIQAMNQMTAFQTDLLLTLYWLLYCVVNYCITSYKCAVCLCNKIIDVYQKT